MSPSDLDVAVDEVTGYFPRIAELLPERSQVEADEHGRHVRVTGSPAPWNDLAAAVLMDIHGGVRAHTNAVRAELGHRRQLFGGSDGVTFRLLYRLPILIEARKTGPSERARRDVLSWPRYCRDVLDELRANEQPWSTAPEGADCVYCNRRLELPPGWRDESNPTLWCRKCPATDLDHRGHHADVPYEGGWLRQLLDSMRKASA